MTAQTAISGGPAVIYRLMAKLACQLTDDQAKVLWQECRTWMLGKGFQDSVAEAECCLDGSLDTWPRNDVMDALANVLTGLSWPLNGSPAAECEAFRMALSAELIKRGYAPV